MGCSSIQRKTAETAIIDCPIVYFSSENNVYIEGSNTEIDIEKVNYKASLNNYGFVGDCISNVDSYIFNIELLILTEPINPLDDKISLPIFALIYDLQDNLIDRRFFRIEDSLNYSDSISNYQITEVNNTLNITSGLEREVGSITIGFIKIN